MVHGVAKSQTRLSDSLTHSLQSSLVSEPGTDRPSLTFLSRMTFWIILCWSSSESLRLTGPEPATSCPLPAQEEHLCRFLFRVKWRLDLSNVCCFFVPPPSAWLTCVTAKTPRWPSTADTGLILVHCHPEATVIAKRELLTTDTQVTWTASRACCDLASTSPVRDP